MKPVSFNGGAPYYADLPVSAGTIEPYNHQSKPTGFISIPGVRAKQFFPVIGCSMEPEILAGHIVGIDDINNWDEFDPDRIYYIITHEKRMIKRLRVDYDDDSILWCMSTNYPDFKIYKSDIKAIHHVVFHGRLI